MYPTVFHCLKKGRRARLVSGWLFGLSGSCTNKSLFTNINTSANALNIDTDVSVIDINDNVKSSRAPPTASVIGQENDTGTDPDNELS